MKHIWKKTGSTIGATKWDKPTISYECMTCKRTITTKNQKKLVAEDWEKHEVGTCEEELARAVMNL